MIVFWIPVAAGILIGKLRGGRFAHLLSLRLSHAWLLPLVAAVQVPLVFAPPRLPEDGIDPLRLLLPISTWAIAGFAVLNRHAPGMRLVLAGAVANALAISANGGLMPVAPDALLRGAMPSAVAFAEAHPGVRLPKSKDVMLRPEETRLYWLSDVVVTPPLPRRKVISLGDLALAAGVACLTAETMRRGAARAPATHIALRRTPRSRQEDERDAPDTIPPWVRPDAVRRGSPLSSGGAVV